jgi:hypothetical protein
MRKCQNHRENHPKRGALARLRPLGGAGRFASLRFQVPGSKLGKREARGGFRRLSSAFGGLAVALREFKVSGSRFKVGKTWLANA